MSFLNAQRFKDVDPVLKESSLKPQIYLSSKTHPVPKRAVPDLKLFENMKVIEKCKGLHNEPHLWCSVMKRLMAMLNYHDTLMLNALDGDVLYLQNQFIEFCDEHYGEHWMMEDHMHFVINHSDLKSTKLLAAALDCKCVGDLANCGGTARHYRDRQQEGLMEKKYRTFFVDIMDSLHFNLLHLVNVGLRVNIDWNLENQ